MPSEYRNPALAYLSRNREERERIGRYLEFSGVPVEVKDIDPMLQDPNSNNFAFFLSISRPPIIVFEIPTTTIVRSHKDFQTLRDQDTESHSRRFILRTPNVAGLRSYLTFIDDIENVAIIGWDRRDLLDQVKRHLPGHVSSRLHMPPDYSQEDFRYV